MSPLPSAIVHHGKSQKGREAEAERILRDYVRGTPVRELCDIYELSRPTIHRRIDQAIKLRVAPTVDAHREQQNALLDDLMQRWSAQCDAADAIVAEGSRTESMSLVERGMTKRAEALNGMLRVVERRAKLNGLDAPTRVEATVEVTTPVDSAVAALAAELEAAG